MIFIDDMEYNAEWQANSLEQTADILNGENTGRLQNTGDMFLDPIGTFFNNSGVIIRGRDCSDTEWDSLFRVLSDPIGEHTVKVPFDQGYMTTQVYISQAKRKLVKKVDNRFIWNKNITVTYTAMSSQWLAGGELEGYEEGVENG